LDRKQLIDAADSRTAPTYPHELSVAVEEIREYGSLQRYKPGVISAYEYWKEARARGLPRGQRDYRKVTRLDGTERLDWRLYLVTVDHSCGYRGEFGRRALYLLRVVPAKLMTTREAAEASGARL
jgi:hypothetical protein